ncbi:MAG: hypothetical protein ACKO5E_18140 [bacterium]
MQSEQPREPQATRMTTPNALPLLMVYELDDSSGHHHVICFQDPVHAGSVGIDVRSIVGRFQPGPEGQFNPATFQFNLAFVEEVSRFMNQVLIHNPYLRDEARNSPDGRLEVIDPRCFLSDLPEIPIYNILGWFAVDAQGQIMPDSFLYNHNHVWFDPESGTSGLLASRPFYDFLHNDKV